MIWRTGRLGSRLYSLWTCAPLAVTCCNYTCCSYTCCGYTCCGYTAAATPAVATPAVARRRYSPAASGAQVFDTILKRGKWQYRASFGWLPAAYLRTMPAYYRGVVPVHAHLAHSAHRSAVSLTVRCKPRRPQPHAGRPASLRSPYNLRTISVQSPYTLRTLSVRSPYNLQVIDHDHGNVPGLLKHSTNKPHLPPVRIYVTCMQQLPPMLTIYAPTTNAYVYLY